MKLRTIAVLLIASTAGCDSCAAGGPTTVTLKGKSILVEWVRADPDRRWLPQQHAPLMDGRGFLIGYGHDRFMHHCTQYLESAPFAQAGYDVVWLAADGKVVDTATLPAKSFEGVTSKVEARFALFLPEGWTKTNSVAVGESAAIAAIITERPPTDLPEIKIGGLPVRVEMATLAAERTRGLMHRTKLSDHNGMLFVYQGMKQHEFWMGNCQIPLDIAFFDDQGKFLNVVPMATYPNPKVDTGLRARSRGPAKYIVEVNLGWFKAKGLVDDKNEPLKPISLDLANAAAAAKEAEK